MSDRKVMYGEDVIGLLIKNMHDDQTTRLRRHAVFSVSDIDQMVLGVGFGTGKNRLSVTFKSRDKIADYYDFEILPHEDRIKLFCALSEVSCVHTVTHVTELSIFAKRGEPVKVDMKKFIPAP